MENRYIPPLEVGLRWGGFEINQTDSGSEFDMDLELKWLLVQPIKFEIN